MENAKKIAAAVNTICHPSAARRFTRACCSHRKGKILRYYKRSEPTIITDFNFYIGLPAYHWPAHSLALTALLLAWYWAGHTARVFDLEKQLRLFLNISSSNGRKVKRLKQDLLFLKEQKLIKSADRYTLLLPYSAPPRVNISYQTLQRLFSEPWRDAEGLCLVCYTAHQRMVRGSVEGLTADSTAKALHMGRKRLRENTARLMEIGVLTRAEGDAAIKVKLHRRRKPLPVHEEWGNHQENIRQLRTLLMGKGVHDFEFGRDEENYAADELESDYWYSAAKSLSGRDGVP